MNFFEHQQESKQKTALLAGCFALAVAAIILSVYAVIMSVIFSQNSDSGAAPAPWFNPDVFTGVAITVLMIILGGSLFKIIAMGRGGPYIAESLGGRPISQATTDVDELKFIHVVEEMALASGISVPAAYVLDREPGINAFAAGYRPEDAVVAVTDGCLRRLSRDELQGVVAHEFSHILNGDMRLNIRLIGMISGILVIASIGNILLRTSSNSRKNGMPFIALGLAFIVIGYVGVLAARIIQSAISRQREFLADASAVQFTRNPSGIAQALKKIGGFAKGSKIRSPRASETSHMFFSTAISSLFATHPALTERIQRIDPSFSREFPTAGDTLKIMTPDPSLVSGLAANRNFRGFQPEGVSQSVGTMDGGHVKFSLMLLDAIPGAVRAELNDPLGASAVVFALLLDTNETEKKNQMDALSKMMPEPVGSLTEKLHAAVNSLDARLKLPLLDLSLPALRRMSDRQYQDFLRAVKILAEADGKLSLFEFTLQIIIRSRLEAAFHPATARVPRKNIDDLTDDIIRLISRLAMEGHADPAAEKNAFSAGMNILPLPGPFEMGNPSFQEVETAILQLANAAPGIRKSVLDACAGCILFDRQVTAEEAELVRAVSYALDLPTPPFLEGGRLKTEG